MRCIIIIPAILLFWLPMVASGQEEGVPIAKPSAPFPGAPTGRTSAAPQTISYQGLLTDSTGTPLEGSYDLTFGLYDVQTGGTALWTEAHVAVPVANGTFSVILGSISSFSSVGVNFNQQLYLGVAEGTNPEFSPRSTLTSAPSSLAPWAMNGSDISYSGGNVGIGVTSPTRKLEVDGVIKATGTTEIEIAPTSGSPAILRMDPGLGVTHAISMENSGSVNWQFGTDGGDFRWFKGFAGEKMRITGNGNVGIGTSSPSAKLDVAGTMKIADGTQGTGKVLTSDVSGLASWQALNNLETDGIIGNEVTSAANTTLTRTGSGTSVSPYQLSLNLANANTWTAAQTFNGQTNFPGSGVWNSSGNVGIGTITPNVKLEVGGLARFTGTGGFSIGSDAGRNRISASSAGTQPFAMLNTSDEYAGLRVRQLSVGSTFGDVNAPPDAVIVESKVGIGTSNPSARLEVSSADANTVIRIENFTSTGFSQLSFGTDISSDNGRIVVNGSANSTFAGANSFNILGHIGPIAFFLPSERMRIDASGNVGIGTTSPSHLLHVNGATRNTTGVWATTSDQRLKKEIEPIRDALHTITELKGVTFRWKDEKKDAEVGRVRGLVAQEVERVIPEWVKTGADGYKHIEPIGVDALLIEAIKEQQKEIDSQNRVIEELRAMVKALADRMPSDLKQSLGELK